MAIVTGSSGLVGAEAVRLFHDKGMMVVGIDNDMRRCFFGPSASTAGVRDGLTSSLQNYVHEDFDIRAYDAISRLFAKHGGAITVVVHAAAQPSHDWAARDPVVDFTVNANGTLNLLEATRLHCPEAAFIFCSTNKVYGDTPNMLPFQECATRWEIDTSHPYAQYGVSENMSIDRSKHSLFGASKAAADLLVQEYGRYFGIKTVCFRAGCITGPGHRGVSVHGFLAYLVRCAVSERHYTVIGYKGKQVRDNMHVDDLVSAFWQYFTKPRPGEVYNIGGGRELSCSVLEAIDLCEHAIGRQIARTYDPEARSGDHIWWISDTRRFREHYPSWRPTFSLAAIIDDIVEANGC